MGPCRIFLANSCLNYQNISCWKPSKSSRLALPELYILNYSASHVCLLLKNMKTTLALKHDFAPKRWDFISESKFPMGLHRLKHAPSHFTVSCAPPIAVYPSIDAPKPTDSPENLTPLYLVSSFLVADVSAEFNRCVWNSNKPSATNFHPRIHRFV